MPNPSKTIVIAAGGTGGHLFPAQALARQLRDRNYLIQFMGKGLSTNPYFDRSIFPFLSVDGSTPFQKKNLLSKLGSLLSISKGIYQSLKGLRSIKPSLVIGFGSFHSFPVLVAALFLRIPIALFESNSIPGKVNRLFSRWAVFSGIQFSSAQNLLKGVCYEVEMPLWTQRGSREESFSYFNLKPDLLTILVFGGSQGAAFINGVIAETLKRFSKENKEVIQVIHMTGSDHSAREIEKKYLESGILCCVKPFEHSMQKAWSVADLVISRSGAATIAEMIEFEVPAIFIPYPTASDQHQLKNALYLRDQVKGAYFLEEKDLSSENLLSILMKVNVTEMKQGIKDFKDKKRKKLLIEYIEPII